jgi:ABC-type lipoprotein export system ATPase subunit
MDALQMIQREQKSTIVIVTHDQRVFEYGDRKLYMTDGKLKM